MIIMYATDNCPKCNILKQRFNENKIEFMINTDTKFMRQQLGIMSVPYIQKDGRLYDFSTAMKMLGGRKI